MLGEGTRGTDETYAAPIAHSLQPARGTPSNSRGGRGRAGPTSQPAGIGEIAPSLTALGHKRCPLIECAIPEPLRVSAAEKRTGGAALESLELKGGAARAAKV